MAAIGIALAPIALPLAGRGPMAISSMAVLAMIVHGRKAARNKDIIRFIRITKGQVALSIALLLIGSAVCLFTFAASSNFWGPFGLFIGLFGLVIQLLVRQESLKRPTRQNAT